MGNISEPDERWVGCAVAFAVILAVVFMACLMLSGCAHCPPCVPEVKTVTVTTPVPVLPHLEPIPQLKLPAWPAPPDADAPGSAWRDWYAAMVATARERLALMHARIDRLMREREALINSTRAPE